MDWQQMMVTKEEGLDLGRLAIFLAMTPNQAMEKELIEQYRGMGIRSAATMLSGFQIATENKVIRNVVNLCLNEKIIEKKREHIHPVVHGILEACQSTRASDSVGQNFCFKAAVVRYKSQIAICLFGNLAMHELSSHKVIGLGMQILGA